MGASWKGGDDRGEEVRRGSGHKKQIAGHTLGFQPPQYSGWGWGLYLGAVWMPGWVRRAQVGCRSPDWDTTTQERPEVAGLGPLLPPAP